MRGALTNEKLIGISELDGKEFILKKLNISFIVHFSFDKYSFNHNTFWTHLIYSSISNLFLFLQIFYSKFISYKHSEVNLWFAIYIINWWYPDKLMSIWKKIMKPESNEVRFENVKDMKWYISILIHIILLMLLILNLNWASWATHAINWWCRDV